MSKLKLFSFLYVTKQQFWDFLRMFPQSFSNANPAFA